VAPTARFQCHQSCHSRCGHQHQRTTGIRILIQPDGGLFATTTDTNGNYVLGILPGWSGTVVAVGSGFVFAPGSRIYTNVTASISNQNYVAANHARARRVRRASSHQPDDDWFGISGVTYQLYFSSNLWTGCLNGDAFPGTNGPVALPVPTTGDPARVLQGASQQLRVRVYSTWVPSVRGISLFGFRA